MSGLYAGASQRQRSGVAQRCCGVVQVNTATWQLLKIQTDCGAEVQYWNKQCMHSVCAHWVYCQLDPCRQQELIVLTALLMLLPVVAWLTYPPNYLCTSWAPVQMQHFVLAQNICIGDCFCCSSANTSGFLIAFSFNSSSVPWHFFQHIASKDLVTIWHLEWGQILKKEKNIAPGARSKRLRTRSPSSHPKTEHAVSIWIRKQSTFDFPGAPLCVKLQK